MNKPKKFKIETTSFSLHIIAMILMLCDHIWATILPAQEWLNCIGRIAFPIFAFLIIEGYYHTSNLKKYIQRLFIYAIISEIPFNLMLGNNIIYPFHQNVIFTFIISLGCIILIEKIKTINIKVITVPLIILVVVVGSTLGKILFVDYIDGGVLTVLTFYLFRENKWYNKVLQVVLLYIINVEILKGYSTPIELFNVTVYLSRQALAILALIPIWLYKGNQGYHSKLFKTICYWFYPAHMLILVAIYRLIIA